MASAITFASQTHVFVPLNDQENRVAPMNEAYASLRRTWIATYDQWNGIVGPKKCVTLLVAKLTEKLFGEVVDGGFLAYTRF